MRGGLRSALAKVAAPKILTSARIAAAKVDRVGLRSLYTNEVAALEKVAQDLLKRGVPESEVAKRVSQLRREIGVKYKDMTPPDLLEYIYKFNESRYGGDKLGPTYDYFKKLGKTDAQIIASASKPLGDLRQLGAALRAHFGEQIVPLLQKYDMWPLGE
jgi:hypothetical protein